MNKKIIVINYGMSNTLSICRALEYCGARVELTDSKEKIERADHLVLPGVGAFHEGMKGLEKRGLINSINKYLTTQRPFLGICLGMQMLLNKSNEFTVSPGIGYFDGQVDILPTKQKNGGINKLPHISWNRIDVPEDISWGDSILQGIRPGSYFYFVHSYYCQPNKKEHVFAVTPFYDYRFSSVIKNGNVFGVQFHPEKSGKTGLKVLENFINL